MITSHPSGQRSLKTIDLHSDLVVIGGGVAGTCAAITAAREGIQVVLVQDRPVLGGNASSEVRLWLLGATSHLGNNNRWSREGGVMNELLEENLYRNRLGNPLIFDTILLEKVMEKKNITLLLNTVAYEVSKIDPDTIASVTAFCSQNSTRYLLTAPNFCDASGDGVVGFLSGAAFRMGAESKDEFNEGFAPDASYGELLGHSMYFYSKDIGEPVKFVAPSWAHKNAAEIAKFRQISTDMQGCNYWWVEFGGRLDTVHDTEEIKWELWKIIYGIWDYIKNSGNFPDAETKTLEWVSHIPGKRESRRFEGDYMMRQQDVIEQTNFEDVVAHGGWSLDLHPSDGVYSKESPCNQWHSKGVYGIPYRSLYSRNINNLFLAGRIISSSHVAFGSTRVMATCGAAAQAIAVAAALCKEQGLRPRDLAKGESLNTLQVRLERAGQFLPGKDLADTADLARQATITASSSLKLDAIKASHSWASLESDWAMLLPLERGVCPEFCFFIDSESPAPLTAELYRAEKLGNFCTDQLVDSTEISLPSGRSTAKIQFAKDLPETCYHFVKLKGNDSMKVRTSEQRISGIVSVTNACNKRVATSSIQSPPDGIGIDTFEFWLPKRRPSGENLALQISPPLTAFEPENIQSGPARPVLSANAWVADAADRQPTLKLSWESEVAIARMVLHFDPDWDHPMESVLMTHPEDVVPFMVKDFDILGPDGEILHQVRDHHSARYQWTPGNPIATTAISIQILATHGAPAAIFRVSVF